MNLRDFQYIIAIAKHRNFTRAASAAAVSQPALSNQIKKLEAELGLPIFKRGKNGVEPTAFGIELLARAQEVVAIVDDISDLARRHSDTNDAPLRLGMTPTLAAYLSGYFKSLFAKDTQRQVVIVEEYPVTLAQMVEERSVDIALLARNSFDMIYQTAKRTMDFAPLWLEPVYLAVRQGHPLSSRGSIWAHQVPADQLIRFDISFGYELEKDLPEPAQGMAERIGIDVKSARFETVCRYVAQSDACTMVNAIAAEQFRRDGFGLAFIPFNDEGSMRELGALTRPEYPYPETLSFLRGGVCEAPPKGTVATCKQLVSLPVLQD